MSEWLGEAGRSLTLQGLGSPAPVMSRARPGTARAEIQAVFPSGIPSHPLLLAPLQKAPLLSWVWFLCNTAPNEGRGARGLAPKSQH